MNVVCPFCRNTFACEIGGECWCARMPAVLPVPADAAAACRCPRCLRATIEVLRPADPCGGDEPDLAAILSEHLDDARSAWSCGTFGAIAEFARDRDEPCTVTTDRGLCASTSRGAIRIEPNAELRAIAYETPGTCVDAWQQGLALCLPAQRSAMAGRRVLTELGPDLEAIRPEDRMLTRFDIGLDVPQIDVCIRLGDPAAIAQLRAYAGRSFFEPGGPLPELILRLNPQRVMQCRFGRVEVYGPIPRPGEQSPDGPHTHVLPRLLAGRLTHAATIPIPPSWVPCMTLFPAHPLAEGRFDLVAHAAFQTLWRRFADPALVAVKARTFATQRSGVACELPTNRHGRVAADIARRQWRELTVARSSCDDRSAGHEREA